MKFEKMIKTFAVVAVATATLSTPKVEAATVEQAAQKIYKAETKAYNQKKDVKVTVKLAAKTAKQTKVIIMKLKEALIKEELGDVDLTYVEPDKYIRPSVGYIMDYAGPELKAKKESISFRHHNFYYPVSRGADQKLTRKGGTVTLKLTVKGSKKYYRDQYEENTYLAKCVAELREEIDGLSDKDAAWTIAQWIGIGYDGDYAYKNRCKPSNFWKKNARGVCEHRSLAYQQFASLMGFKTAYASSDAADHAKNVVKIDGTNYYLDMGSVVNLSSDWEAFVRDGEAWAEHSNIAEFKTWTEDTTIGEWCWLTKKDYAKWNEDANLDSYKPYWNFGSWWKKS